MFQNEYSVIIRAAESGLVEVVLVLIENGVDVRTAGNVRPSPISLSLCNCNFYLTLPVFFGLAFIA